MRAFVKYGRRPCEAGLRETPLKDPQAGEVLVRVAGCGLCGSDLHAYRASAGYEWVKPPVILGHEISGWVEFAPPEVSDFKAGEPVSVIGIQGCGICSFCRSADTHLCPDRKVIGLDFDGGMAPLVWVHRRHLIRLPAAIDPVLAAMIEPLSVAVHALAKVRLRPGAKTVVSGPGPIGVLCGAVAARSGGQVLICGTSADLELRLPAARDLGLGTANIEEKPFADAVAGYFGGELPDLWIEASGAVTAFQAALGQIRRGGTLLAVGMYGAEFPFFASNAVRAELRLQFSYASTYRDYAIAIDLMRGQMLDFSRLAQPVPLEQAEAVFREASSGRTLKPILVP